MAFHNVEKFCKDFWSLKARVTLYFTLWLSTRLLDWISEKKKSTTLNQDKINRLETLKGWTWNPKQFNVDLKALALIEFFEINQRLPMRRDNNFKGFKIYDLRMSMAKGRVRISKKILDKFVKIEFPNSDKIKLYE